MASSAACACGGDGFREGLLKGLADLQRHALSEVERLHGDLAGLRAENELLWSRLGGRRDSCTSSRSASGSDGEAGEGFDWRPSSSSERGAASSRSTDWSLGAAEGRDRWPPRGCCPLGPDGLECQVPGSAETSPHRRASELSGRGSRTFLSLPGENEVSKTSTSVRSVLAKKAAGGERPSSYKDTGCAQSVVKSRAFVYGTHVLVLLNALWIAVDTDLNGKPLLESPLAFQVVDHFFAVAFVVELVLRFLAFESKPAALLDRWFLFDLATVSTLVLEVWVLTFFVLVTGSAQLRGISHVSALRSLRTLRVVRVARICQLVPELETMVAAMLAGIRSVLVAAVILLVVTYTFAVCIRQLGSSTSWGDEYFGSVPHSIYSLLVFSILPDNATLLHTMMLEKWYCGVLYFLFLLFTTVTIMNLLIGLLCNVIYTVSHEESEHRSIESMSKRLRGLFRSRDSDTDGFVTKNKFEAIFENEEAVKLLSKVGVDVVALADEADFIFSQHSRAVLTFEEFKEVLLMFRSTSCATAGSIMATRRFVRHSLEEIAGTLAGLEGAIQRLEATGSYSIGLAEPATPLFLAGEMSL